MLVLGLGVFMSGTGLWVNAGLPFNLGELSTMLFGTKPWHLEKESYFFLVILGIFITGYAAFELHLKRWEKN